MDWNKNKVEINFNKSRNSLIIVIGFFAILGLIVSVFSNFNQSEFDVFFNSDTLYLPSIYKDLFVDKNPIKGWHFNASPNLFPDMILYFLLMLINSSDFILCSFLFGVIQCVVILILFSKIFKEVLPNYSRHWIALSYILLSFFFLESLFFSKDFTYTFYLISNSYHVGSFVLSLFCFFITLKIIKTSDTKFFILLFIMGLLGVFSDRLFIVLYAIPMFITSLFFYKKIETRKNVKLILVFCLFVLIGLKIFVYTGHSGVISFVEPHRIMSFDTIKSSFEIYTNQMLGYLTTFGFRAFTIYLFIASLLCMIILFFQTKKTENFIVNLFSVYSLVFSGVVIIAPIINGNYSGTDTLRYNIYPFYFACLSLIVFIANQFKSIRLIYISKYVIMVFCGLIFVIALSKISTHGLKNYFNYYPKVVKDIDEISNKQNLLCGIGNYWDAKKVTLFSKKGVKIYSVFDDLTVYDHLANVNWFFGKNKFNFVLLNKNTDTTVLSKTFSSYHVVHNTHDYLLIKTNVYIYQKDKCCLPINNWRSN